MRYPAQYIEQLTGMAQLILAMVFAGSTVVVGKSLAESLPVFMIAFCTLLVAFLTLLPLAYGRWKEIKHLGMRQWGALFMQSLCGIILFRVLALYGLQYTGAVEAGVIMGTTPAILTVLAAVILGERPSPGGITGVGCAVSGMIILNTASAEKSGETHLLGCLLVFGAVVAEALFTVFRKMVAQEISAITNTACLIGISLTLMFPFAVWEFQTYHILPGLPDLLSIGYYGIIGTVVAYLLWTHGVGKVSTEAAGIATAAMPASSVFLAILILGEPLNHLHILGCVIVISGIAFSATLNRSEECSPEV